MGNSRRQDFLSSYFLSNANMQTSFLIVPSLLSLGTLIFWAKM